MSIKERPDLEEIVYPDSDGQPMADNTVQFEWISTLKNGLENLFRNDPDVFVAGDLLWYPVEGDPTCRCAPDVLVAFGRPKGDRGSYMQWREGGIAPQVVIEVLSPGNRRDNMTRKLRFYEQYGVEEYYVYDPDRVELFSWMRVKDRLVRSPASTSCTSPRLGTRFEIGEGGLVVRGQDGSPLRSYRTVVLDEELKQAKLDAEQQRADAEQQRADAERQRADLERHRADAESRRADAERQRANAERQRADELVARLRELGVDVDAS